MIYLNPIAGRTGLCNMLCPWARAFVFLRKRGGSMLSPQWSNIFRIGPILRGERDKRFYLNQFTNSGYVGGFRRLALLGLCKHVDEHVALGFCDEELNGAVVDFAGNAHAIEPFFTEHELVKNELYRIVNPEIVDAVKRESAFDYVGVHIRRGDFARCGQGIPNDWYIRAIRKALKTVGDMPIRVFSDDDPKVLQEILDSFEHIELMPKAPAIHDVLLLSRAKTIVGTRYSSFSYWATWLGQQEYSFYPVGSYRGWRLDGTPVISVE